MKYFDIQLPVDKAHDLFIHLSKLYHPDSNSNNDGTKFAEMKNEYEDYKILKKYEKYLFYYFSNIIKPKTIVKEIVREVFVENPNHLKANEVVDKILNYDYQTIHSTVKDIKYLVKNVNKILKK